MTLTECFSMPCSHQATKALNHTTRFNGLFLRLGLLIKVGQRNFGYFITTELCKKLLLCRQVKVLVALHLFLHARLTAFEMYLPRTYPITLHVVCNTIGGNTFMVHRFEKVSFLVLVHELCT